MDKTGRFLPKDPVAKFDAIQWMMVQMTLVGPMFGQYVHFMRFAPKGNDYSLYRYRAQVRRVLATLEQRLSVVPWRSSVPPRARCCCGPSAPCAPMIGIGGHLAVPPLPHHRAYGSVPRRFDQVKLGRRQRVGADRVSGSSGCAALVGPPGALGVVLTVLGFLYA